MSRRQWLFASIALIALLTGALLSWNWQQPASRTQSGPGLVGLALPDLDGRQQSFEQWHGKVLLLNFWATWCPPCREEIPLFMSLREQYQAQGFEVIGIAIDDNEKVKDYRDEFFIDYPLLQGSRQSVQLMKFYGNRVGVLPYSVLFDRQGRSIHFKSGAFSRQELENLIKQAL